MPKQRHRPRYTSRYRSLHVPREVIWFIRLKNARTFVVGLSRRKSGVLSPEGAATYQPRAIAAASAAKRRPGVVIRQVKSPERATQAVVDHGLKFWARHGCFALSGLLIYLSRHPGRRCACPGLICRRPFGAEDRASFSRMNQIWILKHNPKSKI